MTAYLSHRVAGEVPTGFSCSSARLWALSASRRLWLARIAGTSRDAAAAAPVHPPGPIISRYRLQPLAPPPGAVAASAGSVCTAERIARLASGAPRPVNKAATSAAVPPCRRAAAVLGSAGAADVGRRRQVCGPRQRPYRRPAACRAPTYAQSVGGRGRSADWRGARRGLRAVVRWAE